jgi:hypothetical protein
VNYEIVEIEQFSGSEAKVYSIIPEGEEITLYDKFLKSQKVILSLSENLGIMYTHFSMKKTVI